MPPKEFSIRNHPRSVWPVVISETNFIGDGLRIAQPTVGSTVLRQESLNYMRYLAEHEPENELDKCSVDFLHIFCLWVPALGSCLDLPHLYTATWNKPFSPLSCFWFWFITETGGKLGHVGPRNQTQITKFMILSTSNCWAISGPKKSNFYIDTPYPENNETSSNKVFRYMLKQSWN